MTANTAQKLQSELNSLQGLSIINLVCAALAMAFGVYFLMPNLIKVATTLTVDIDQVGLMILGGVAWAVAIKWLVSCAKIIDTTSKINLSFKEQKQNNSLDDVTLTGFIVKLTAAYRENKPTLKLMVKISKIAGVLFAVAATLALVQGLIGAATGAVMWGVTAQLVNAAISYGTAAACFIIPHYFSNYSNVWDNRLKETEKAEKLLEQQLGSA
jgi:hypothetical protein